MMLGVVTVNYYSTVATQTLIASLMDGSIVPDYFCIVDNGCTPSEVPDLLSLESVGVTILRLTQNAGYGGAVNRGVQHCLEQGCTALLILNNDVTVSPDTLAELLDAWDPLSEIRSPLILLEDSDQNNGEYVWWAGGSISPILGRATHHHGPSCIAMPKSRLSEVGFISGCSLLVGAQAWRTIGGFSEDYFLYWEDVDLSYRAKQMKLQLRCVGTATIRHQVGGSSGTGDRFASPTAYYFGSRNRWLFISKTTSNSLAWYVNLLLSAPRLLRLWFRTRGKGAVPHACFRAAVQGTRDGIAKDYSRREPLRRDQSGNLQRGEST